MGFANLEASQALKEVGFPQWVPSTAVAWAVGKNQEWIRLMGYITSMPNSHYFVTGIGQEFGQWVLAPDHLTALDWLGEQFGWTWLHNYDGGYMARRYDPIYPDNPLYLLASDKHSTDALIIAICKQVQGENIEKVEQFFSRAKIDLSAPPD